MQCSCVVDKEGASGLLCPSGPSFPGHWSTREGWDLLRSLLPTSTPKGVLDVLLPPSLYRNLVP